ncbi:peptidase U32 family protein [Salisediminibacterium beveridgei]|uniref:Peptidase, U32 family large subunit (C1) n=1 Tax=Salisediminibacterium beveridgei TaxID=632773 RepID=A0A1D7QU16_9BACI|nr:U32 family peptidase [Salisediminibacterium beveridgei]AOM82510.1 peptidase, U32 family large subunit (C1) [Salisediminibacterium beveridgei]
METISQQSKKTKRVITKKPELLAPAGNLEKLKVAVRYGADAVFIGGQDFGLRSNADNFSSDEMSEAVEFANQYGACIYVTTNIFAHNENMEGLESYLEGLQRVGIKGIIVADPLIIETCKQYAPELEIHLSTQQSLTNWQAVQFWKDEGLDRVVLAREVGLQEMLEMKKHVDIEIESFIHGAMCISYSGRCTLSNHMTARDSNRGGCCQSCRWDYFLYQDGNTPVVDDAEALFDEDDAPFAMSPKDLNLVESIPKMIEAGIDSLKVEGRMKSIHYIATVIGVYRKVIDSYCEDPDGFTMKKEWIKELEKCANRPAAPAFFEHVPGFEEQMFREHKQKTPFDFAGLVLDYDEETGTVTLQQRNHFRPGDQVEFFGPDIESFSMTVGEIINDEGESVDAARHPLQVVSFKTDRPVSPYNMMRKELS